LQCIYISKITILQQDETIEVNHFFILVCIGRIIAFISSAALSLVILIIGALMLDFQKAIIYTLSSIIAAACSYLFERKSFWDALNTLSSILSLRLEYIDDQLRKIIKFLRNRETLTYGFGM
jgi:hypothetical protein